MKKFRILIFLLIHITGYSRAVTLEDCKDALSEDNIQNSLFDALAENQSLGLLFSSCHNKYCRKKPLKVTLQHCEQNINFLVYPVENKTQDNKFYLEIGSSLASHVVGQTFNTLFCFIQNRGKVIYLNGAHTNSVIAACEYGDQLLEQVVPESKLGVLGF